jgi:hypothetical protein
MADQSIFLSFSNVSREARVGFHSHGQASDMVDRMSFRVSADQAIARLFRPVNVVVLLWFAFRLRVFLFVLF